MYESSMFLFILFFFLPASVCFAVCLLSLAWALVLYARACSLIRPGHLQMTQAAILCRLLWRVGLRSAVYSYDGVWHHSITLLMSLFSYLCWQVSMLGSRFAVLMLFARVFKQWVLGVIGRSSFIPPSFSSDWIKWFQCTDCCLTCFYQVCTGSERLSGWCRSRPTSSAPLAVGDYSTSFSGPFTSSFSSMWNMVRQDIAWWASTWYVYVLAQFIIVSPNFMGRKLNMIQQTRTLSLYQLSEDSYSIKWSVDIRMIL